MYPLLLATSLAEAAELQADLHLDTPTQLHRSGKGFAAEGLEAGLAQLRAGGTNVAVEVLWPPRGVDWEAHVGQLFDIVEAEDARSEALTMVRSVGEAERVVAEGGIALVVALEGAHGVDKSGVEGLRRLHARGLSMLGLTWSFSNRFAGSSGDGGGGITAEGWQLVVEANRLGVMVDVSHASDKATMDACSWSHAPVVASHSNTDGVHPAPRNLSDAAIRCIARGGGVIGVNVHDEFVGGGKDVGAVADHVEHLREVGGLGVVALGSDYDGIIRPAKGLADASRLGALWEELRRRGWADAEITAARGGNFVRVWRAVERIGRALRGERVAAGEG